MKIEIRKINVTKGIIKQLREASIDEIIESETLGYVRGVYSNNDEYVLLKHKNNYLKINALWELRGAYLGYNIVGKRGEFIKRVSNPEEYYSKYINVIEKSKKIGQIFY